MEHYDGQNFNNHPAGQDQDDGQQFQAQLNQHFSNHQQPFAPFAVQTQPKPHQHQFEPTQQLMHQHRPSFDYQSSGSSGSSYQAQSSSQSPLYSDPSTAQVQVQAQAQFGWNNQQLVPDWMLPQQNMSLSPVVGSSDGSAWGGLSSFAPTNYGPAGLTAPLAQAQAPMWPLEQTSLSSSARLKPFIEKLYSILSQPANFRDCLVWDEGGTCFIVSHANPRLLSQVLPDAFGHSNLHSFTSQSTSITLS